MKKILLAVIIALFVFAGISYFAKDNGKITGEATATRTIPVEMKIQNGQTLKSNVKEGQTALEYLDAQADIKTKGEGVSAYVVAINGLGVDADKNEFWSFYVNGKMAEVGAGSYKLMPNDKIEWKIENY